MNDINNVTKETDSINQQQKKIEDTHSIILGLRSKKLLYLF
jgi:hypothetical protein